MHDSFDRASPAGSVDAHRTIGNRRVTMALHTNEIRYRELIEGLTDAVAVYEAVDSGRDFVFLAHNRAGERITGLTRDQVIGHRLTETFPRAEELGLLAVLRRLWRTGKARSYPTCLYQDGRISRWLESHLFKLTSGELVAVYRDISARMQSEEAMHRSRERLRHLAACLTAAQEEERTTIAREVYDQFTQAVIGLKMDLSWLGDHLPEGRTNAFKERLEAADALADTTLDGMRRLAARLRPPLLDDLGLVATIEWQVKAFTDRVGCGCDLDLTDEDIGRDSGRDTAVYRILQEALSNVACHARATRVSVSLKAVDDILELAVTDDGRGISESDIESMTSTGLTGMQERAETHGGQVAIRSGPDGGTRVSLRIPRSVANACIPTAGTSDTRVSTGEPVPELHRGCAYDNDCDSSYHLKTAM